ILHNASVLTFFFIAYSNDIPIVGKLVRTTGYIVWGILIGKKGKLEEMCIDFVVKLDARF
ncbi:TPA: hypothetical protein ACPJVX_000157, partial [Haemophilus influenzae]